MPFVPTGAADSAPRSPESRARGPEIPLLEKTIGQVLADAARDHPDAAALVSCHQRLRFTYGELSREVDRVAAGLWGLGLRPGDRVGVWASNCAEWVFLQFAAARVGAVLVNINPAYRSHELRYVVRGSRMKAIFLRERDSRADYPAILRNAVEGQTTSLRHIIVLGQGSWEEMLQRGEAPPAVPVSPADVANIQYTSGTTGAPKGVLLTHRNLVNNAMLVGRQLQASPADRLCSPVPLYHCFGCVMSSLMTAVHGAALILPAPQFNALDTLRSIHQERCTMIYGVPTMFIAELEHPEFSSFDLASLRTGIMAGAPCPIEVMRRVVGDMHCPELTIAYGLTEASPVITMSSTTDPVELRVTSVGKVLPDTEVKVISPTTNEIVEAGEIGELCTRGYLVMSGYDGDPQATAAAIDEEGWLHTGDLAVMREDGYFHIRGRLKDTIIRGGENVYPREVEEFLHTHPKIADVYVVGLPDPRLGETVLAWIRIKEGAELTAGEVIDYCRGKIAYFKIPEHIRFVDGFPMTVSGKIQKFRIRATEMEERGLRELGSAETA
jgi:fatty-acyl-CoA synthase